MTVTLQSPFKNQTVGTLYTGSEEAWLVANGLASLLPTEGAGTGSPAALPAVQLSAPYQGFGVGAIYNGADRALVVAQGLGFFLGTVAAGDFGSGLISIFALTLGGEPLTLGGQYLTLGAPA